MIDRHHPRLSITRQCSLVCVSRSSFYYEPQGESPENLAWMRRIDEQYLKTPWYGSRQMVRHYRRRGERIGRHRIRRLMRIMGLAAIYQTPKTSKPHPEHKIYPYLLRNVPIEKPDHVWCADITYIPMRNGFLYLVAIMDWVCWSTVFSISCSAPRSFIRKNLTLPSVKSSSDLTEGPNA